VRLRKRKKPAQEPEQHYIVVEENIEEDIKNTEPTKSLDKLLADLISEQIKRGEIEFKPTITLVQEGKYNILGRKWTGKISLEVAHKQSRLEEFSEKNPEKEKAEEDEEIPLF